ncbi:50S ribosomal protein L15 [Rubricoccus marinus]|uniref:Large ribosomal subunit protein uL15 n=1 Tax=Rubricoccus marinus TaxID=716817 RepID=A0A259U192_9BACT|nr:50S ribosomal protein L15 [Rubricoccus marinus]OZC03710.1 50S ribosomal protein L15 [Rubricoccus marinus]
MDLSKLTPAKGSTKTKKRIGRGEGSGNGGTAGKGHNGQKSRSGASIPAWFEGGQMPLQRRVPKFGFKNRFRVAYDALNLDRLAALVETGAISEGDTVNPASLKAMGFGGKNGRVKVLGGGDINVKLDVHAHAFSASAREKIEAAGGSVTIVD